MANLCPLGRTAALVVLFALLIAAVVACAVWPGVANSILCSMFASWILCGTVAFLFCVKTREEESAHLAAIGGEELHIPEVGLSATPALPRARSYYLDNVKSVLTAIVVLHHTTCAFVGAGWYYQIGNYSNIFQVFGQALLGFDQSFFMSLFFFISGYFVPSSYDRKGARGFLRDKFKRLGLPFLVYFLVIGPLLNMFTQKVALGEARAYTYAPEAGPPWFVAWLLLLCSAYTAIGGPSVTFARPSLGRLVLVSIGAGILQGLVCAVITTGSFVYMPITVGSLPFDIMFFAGGIIAKRNAWLDEAFSKRESIASAVWTIVIAVVLLVVMFLHYRESSTPASHDARRLAADSTYSTLSVSVFSVCMGPPCVIISLCFLAFFKNYFDYTTARTKFFSEAAYAVYLIHPWIVVTLTWSYVLLLKAVWDIEVVFPQGQSSSATNLGNAGLLLLGWVYTAVLGQLIVWPLAWGVKKLPGFNQIL